MRTDIHIRVNQIGFSQDDVKGGVVLSSDSLENECFEIIETSSKKIVHKGLLGNNFGKYGNFENSYRFDFSKLTDAGDYRVRIRGVYSYAFSVGENLFVPIVDSLLQFFKVQRCGYTEPHLHEICHKADAVGIIHNGKNSKISVDLSGGWHDAGDYIKFLNTTAFATYTLLFSYDFNPEKFDFDRNGNSVPDILEEAKVGLDWLLRCNYKKYKLISQVQDLRDHDVGWRLPEDDPLEYERMAFSGIGKNTIGIYAATMALAAKIWREKFHMEEYSDKCLTAAENLFSVRDKVPDVDSTGTGAYHDNNFEGKLALGAVELYRITNREEYLKIAKEFADKAGASFWWSYGDIADFAHYRLSEYDDKYGYYIEQGLDHFKDYFGSHVFGQGTEFTWGSNNTLLGISLKNILLKKIMHVVTYDSLAISQRDFILGKNPWGICFITNFGTKYSRNLHHQVSSIKNINLPGGFAAGPVPKSVLDSYNIPFYGEDRYSKFQADEAVYRDDKMDYITNEPTITANATAIFVFGNYKK